MRTGIGENVLDKIVAILIAGDVDERDAWTIRAPFADAVKVAVEEVGTTDLQALFDDLGRELIHAVLGSIAQDLVDGPAAVGGSTMLANVLDAPIAELTLGNDVDVRNHLVDTRALFACQWCESFPDRARTLSSSRQFSKMFCTTRLPVSPRATSCHMPCSASLTYFMI